MRHFSGKNRGVRKSALLAFVSLAVGLVVLTAGCGPTKKEYAINEALLIDQTRMLENQLYRAHFQVQRLEQENKRLRAQLEAKGIKAETPSSVPLDNVDQLNVGMNNGANTGANNGVGAQIPVARGGQPARYPSGTVRRTAAVPVQSAPRRQR